MRVGDQTFFTLTVQTRDMGATQIATIYFGRHVLGQWHTHTGHAESSIEIVEEALVALFKPLVEQAMETAECRPFDEEAYYRGEG